MDLNDKAHLNPDLGILTPEEKAEGIENWNNKPVVQQNNIKAIDMNKEKNVRNGKYYVLWVFAVIGLLIIAISAGVIGYTVYKDGTLKNPVSQICGNYNLTCEKQECQSCQPCQECQVCGDCKPQLNCGNQS